MFRPKPLPCRLLTPHPSPLRSSIVGTLALTHAHAHAHAPSEWVLPPALAPLQAAARAPVCSSPPPHAAGACAGTPCPPATPGSLCAVSARLHCVLCCTSRLLLLLCPRLQLSECSALLQRGRVWARGASARTGDEGGWRRGPEPPCHRAASAWPPRCASGAHAAAQAWLHPRRAAAGPARERPGLARRPLVLLALLLLLLLLALLLLLLLQWGQWGSRAGGRPATRGWMAGPWSVCGSAEGLRGGQ